MKFRNFILIAGVTLIVCKVAFAGFSVFDTVYTPRTCEQLGRGNESGWPLCIDDSLVIHVVWEELQETGGTEIHYRARKLRENWRAEVNTTVNDTNSYNPGHASVATIKASSYPFSYRTAVGYASQTQYGEVSANEYKNVTFSRGPSEGWDFNNFRFISGQGSPTMCKPSGVSSGGQKTGNLIDNGDGYFFASWPYLMVRNVGGVTKNCRKPYYSIGDGSSWASETAISPLPTTDTVYWVQDVSAYPDPNHDIHFVYAFSTDDNCYNVYYSKYDWDLDSFSTPRKLSDATGTGKATLPYVVCEDKGDDGYVLHFTWMQIEGGYYKVKYCRYVSNGSTWVGPGPAVDSSYAKNPTIAVTQDGTIYIAWEDRSIGKNNIGWKSASPPYYSWSGKSNISAPAGTDSVFSPILVRDKVGNLHMTAAVYDGPTACQGTSIDVYYTINDLPPIKPTVQAVSDPSHPKFAWNKCNETNFRKYKIFRKLGTAFYYTPYDSIFTSSETTYTDNSLSLDETPPNRNVSYYVITYDVLGQGSSSNAIDFSVANKLDGRLVPLEYTLAQNYPNPFNPSTNISYQIPEACNVSIEVFDICGRRTALLVDENQTPGSYQVKWYANENPSGIYFYRIIAGEFSQTRKMLLTK